MKLLLSLFTLLALLVPARSAPNVIVIFADDLGWPDGGTAWSQYLGSLGRGVPATTDLKTPNLDLLAQNGVRFTNGYVTSPICSPSRAGLMTGRHAQRFGYEMNPGELLEHDPIFGLPVTESTLGDRMKALGYATAWIGKSHLGALQQYHPVARGFEQFFGFLEGHHHYCTGGPGSSCILPNGDPPPWDADPIQRATAPLSLANPPERVAETAYLTQAFAREILAYLNDRFDNHPNQPFCIYAPFNAVHEPMEVPATLLEETSSLFPGDSNDPATASIRHKMAGMLLALDLAVGAIMQNLSTHGQLENTLIFFSSDNGAPPSTRGDKNGSTSLPLRGNKSELYEGGIRVPFILHWPARYAARTVHAPVSTMDILPTCVEAAGGTVPAAWQLDGVSLLPYLDGTAPEPHPIMYWRVETGRADEMDPGPRAMRQGQWKLIKTAWSRNWELYDLNTDDGFKEKEIANVADAHPEKLREMIPLYESWEATLPRPRWDFNDPDYVTPTFVLEDLRVGSTTASYVAPEFLPNSNQMAWQDDAGKLLRGTLDLNTGFLTGMPVEVTSGIAPPSLYNEGPQWALSTAGPSLFYTKTGTPARLQIWRDTTQLTTHMILDNFGPRVSQNASSPVVGMIFNRGVAGSSTTMAATDAAPATVASLPNQTAVPRNGRWIPGTQDIIYVRTGTPTQLARFNTATQSNFTLTDDTAGDKTEAWAFRAPEFGGEICYACLVDRTSIAIYRDLKRAGGFFDRVATLTVPATETARFLSQMKPIQGRRGFNGVSWFSCAASQNSDVANPGATAIWLLGLGTDAAHRLPMPPPLTGRNDLCLEWKPLALRVSDPLAAGVASEPETVIGTREVFCYYTRKIGTGPAQLRRARTGLVRPDAEMSGFAALTYQRDYTPGASDGSQRMGGTETTGLVAHDGKLFAALSSRGDSTSTPGWSGVQFLFKDSPGGDWHVDHSGNLSVLFAGHRAVDVLTELTFTREGAVPMNSPVKHLVAGLSDVGGTGQYLASARTRTGPAQWAHSEIATTIDPSHALSFAVHLDRDVNNDGIDDGTTQAGVILGVERIFAGLSNGEIYRGAYDSTNLERLVWNKTTADLSTATIKLGPVTGLAEANDALYAACGIRQDAPGAAVTGGLYRRNDHTDTWQLIYTWPVPQLPYAAPEAQRIMNSLTAVPDPRGCAHQVLLAARSWPGVVELIDPGRDHAVSVELDVRDFFARRWNDDTVRDQAAVIGYTPFTPATDPVTGEAVHLLGVWIEQPGAVNTATHFLIRHSDGTWEAADIPGINLRGTRCFAVSPFAADNTAAIYFGGYDVGSQSAHDTAWVIRGTWNDWPELSIAPAGPQTAQLSWPFTSTDWLLESSPSLSAWQPVPDKPTQSLTGTTLNLPTTAPHQYFRLRRP